MKLKKKEKQSYSEAITTFEKNESRDLYGEKKDMEKSIDHDVFKNKYKTRKMTFKKVKYV